MQNYMTEGTNLRRQIKALILDFMKNTEDCSPNACGMTQAEIFRDCGMDWGDYPKAESRRQQYWVIAILCELEYEGKIKRVSKAKGTGNNWCTT